MELSGSRLPTFTLARNSRQFARTIFPLASRQRNLTARSYLVCKINVSLFLRAQESPYILFTRELFIFLFMFDFIFDIYIPQKCFTLFTRWRLLLHNYCAEERRKPLFFLIRKDYPGYTKYTLLFLSAVARTS